ncbi:unnamed protein product [Cochlearia groenlandica]
MQSMVCPKPQRILTVLGWQCAIYHIWTERNSRRHRQAFRSSDSIFDTVSSTLKNRIASFRETNQPLASSMLQQWMDY